MIDLFESVFVGGPQGRLIGILCEPERSATSGAATTGIIFLNAGNTHRVGPNRLYVTLSRVFARRGFTCCRFDISGLGDSTPRRDGRRFRDYAPLETQQVMGDLEKCRGLKTFILVGLCGGADIAFDVASEDDRVIAVVLVNGAFVDGENFASAYYRADKRTLQRFYRRRIFSLIGWVRVVTLRSALWKTLLKKAQGKVKRRPYTIRRPTMEQSGGKWAALAKRNIEVLMIFSEGSVFWDMFRVETSRMIQESCPPDRLQVVMQKTTDHTFTLLSSQQILAGTILSWLDKKAFLAEWNEDANVG